MHCQKALPKEQKEQMRPNNFKTQNQNNNNNDFMKNGFPNFGQNLFTSFGGPTGLNMNNPMFGNAGGFSANTNNNNNNNDFYGSYNQSSNKPNIGSGQNGRIGGPIRHNQMNRNQARTGPYQQNNFNQNRGKIKHELNILSFYDLFYFKIQILNKGGFNNRGGGNRGGFRNTNFQSNE